MTKKKKVPSKLFNKLVKKYPEIFDAHEKLGVSLKQAGPIDAKNLHFIQLGAAAAAGSQGAVHSHTRRALAEGASEDEIYHALLSLISTIGFPQAMAAVSWARDILEK